MLLGAVVIGLAQLGIEPWLSALIVAMVTGIAGYMLVQKGWRTCGGPNRPAKTIESLKETATWTTRTPA